MGLLLVLFVRLLTLTMAKFNVALSVITDAICKVYSQHREEVSSMTTLYFMNITNTLISIKIRSAPLVVLTHHFPLSKNFTARTIHLKISCFKLCKSSSKEPGTFSFWT